MEKLGAPQTHVGLKNMIAEIDEDNDGKVSYREVNNGVLSLIHDVSLTKLYSLEVWGFTVRSPKV